MTDAPPKPRRAACRLRRATMDDAETLLSWRNHDDVRRFMHNDALIALEDHLAWFARALADPSRAHHLLEIDERAVGVIAVYNHDPRHRRAEWTFHVDPFGAPKGAGSAMWCLALDHAFHEMRLHKLLSEVLDFNTRSLRMHEGFGFRIEGLRRAHAWKEDRWCDVYELGLFNDDWAARRDTTFARVFEL